MQPFRVDELHDTYQAIEVYILKCNLPWLHTYIILPMQYSAMPIFWRVSLQSCADSCEGYQRLKNGKLMHVNNHKICDVVLKNECLQVPILTVVPLQMGKWGGDCTLAYNSWLEAAAVQKPLSRSCNLIKAKA